MTSTTSVNQSQEQINPVTQAVQRCLEAYHHVLESNPKPPKSSPAYASYDKYEVEKQAQKAFLRLMPFLDSWEHVLCGLACLQHAILLDIFDRVDAGRHIHLLQLAISAYRPKVEPRPVGRPERSERITPLPSPSAPETYQLGTYVSPYLPDESTQAKLGQELKRRQVPIPTPQEAYDAPRLLPLLFALAEVYQQLPKRQPPVPGVVSAIPDAPGPKSSDSRGDNRPQAAA